MLGKVFFAHGSIKYKSLLNSSIWLTHHCTTLGQSGPGSNGNGGVHHTHQSARIEWNLVSIPEHAFFSGGGGAYPLAAYRESIFQTTSMEHSLLLFHMVDWLGGGRIHQLHLCRRVRALPTSISASVLDITSNYLMPRPWRFGDMLSTSSWSSLPGPLRTNWSGST